MRAMRMTGVIGIVALCLLGGCTTHLREENASLLEENRGLREQLMDRNMALEATQADLKDEQTRSNELRRQLADAEHAAELAMKAPAAVPAADPFAGIAGVTGSIGAGEVTASVASDVLFAPGQAVLRSSAKRSLEQVARILRSDYAGRVIRVAGHTDTDPIRKSGFKSNYHLGFERAYVVRQFLVEQGLPSNRVYVASHGPDQAKATKKDSRRVEIAVVLNES